MGELREGEGGDEDNGAHRVSGEGVGSGSDVRVGSCDVRAVTVG